MMIRCKSNRLSIKKRLAWSENYSTNNNPITRHHSIQKYSYLAIIVLFEMKFSDRKHFIDDLCILDVNDDCYNFPQSNY